MKALEQRTIALNEYQRIYDATAVSPASYKKPVRIYCDINGVIQPEGRSPEELYRYQIHTTDVDVFPLDPSMFFGTGRMPVRQLSFWWNPAIIERLADLTRSPDVDFVWFTSWRVSAPYALDELLGLNSLGFLDWHYERNDRIQAHKKVQIIEDQKNSPSKFIWLDDRANIPPKGQSNPFASIQYDGATGQSSQIDRISSNQFLNIITSAKTGITMENLDAMETWVKANTLKV